MPTYHYKCQHCGAEKELVMRMKDHSNVIYCRCGKLANQIIKSAPIITIPQHMRYDWNGYESPIDGRPIVNKRQRIEDMARSDCIEYDPGMKQDYDRRLKEDDARLERMVDETVEREIETMPVRKKERLTAELDAGFEAQVTRG